MAAGRIVLPPYFPARDRNARLAPGAKLTVWDNGTTDKASVYAEAALVTPLANPVTANSSGQFPSIWADAGTEADPVLYSLGITAEDGSSLGNTAVFDDYRPSVDYETAATAIAEAASVSAAVDADRAEDAYTAILAFATEPGDAAAIASRLNLTASNVSDAAALRTNIGADQAANSKYRSAGTGAQETTVAVRFSRQPILVDEFYQSADGSDYGPAFCRAYAAGLAQTRNLICTSGAAYDVATNIDILPNLAGWTPSIDLAGSTITLTAEAGGFRRRGLKDGAVANVSSGRIYGGTIDANNITGANGVRCIFGSNSSGTVDDVDIINMSQGYGWRRFCYADGGAATGARPIFSGNVSGITDAGTATRWYGCVDDGDASYVQPGSPIAAGTARPLATVNSTQDSTGCANIATMRYWSNGTGSPINVPAAMTSASYVSAGLTSGATDVTINGVSMAAAKAEVYTSACVRFPRNVVRPSGAIFRNAFVTGGYYGLSTFGTDGVWFDNVGSYGAVRGIACEFGAVNVRGRKVLVTDSLSSGVLVNYGSTGADFEDVSILGGSRWDGQAMFNVQLGASGLSLTNLKTVSGDNVTNGEYHFYIGPHCSDARVRGLDLRGDCIKAFIGVESAWRTTSGSAENYNASTEYAGLASVALSNIDISEVTITVPSGTSATGTAIALCQSNDTTNGEIGLSGVRLRNISAMSSKHGAHLVVREMATATPTVTGAISIRLTGFACPTITDYLLLKDDIILPRGRKHFSSVSNATNIVDDTQRSIENSATPNITYGTRFVTNGGSAITNFRDNGSGSSGQKPASGHVAILRGSGAQAVNNNGSAGGTLLKGGATVTPGTTEELTIRYDSVQDAMIEVARGF